MIFWNVFLISEFPTAVWKLLHSVMKHFFKPQNEDLQYKHPWHPAARQNSLIPSFKQNLYNQLQIYASGIQQRRASMRGGYSCLWQTTLKCCLEQLKMWLLRNACPWWDRQKEFGWESKKTKKGVGSQWVPPRAAVRVWSTFLETPALIVLPPRTFPPSSCSVLCCPGLGYSRRHSIPPAARKPLQASPLSFPRPHSTSLTRWRRRECCGKGSLETSGVVVKRPLIHRESLGWQHHRKRQKSHWGSLPHQLQCHPTETGAGVGTGSPRQQGEQQSCSWSSPPLVQSGGTTEICPRQVKLNGNMSRGT